MCSTEDADAVPQRGPGSRGEHSGNNIIFVKKAVILGRFSLFCRAHSHKLEISLRGLNNLYTYTPLTFDLTSDQEQLPKKLSQEEKGKKGDGM